MLHQDAILSTSKDNLAVSSLTPESRHKNFSDNETKAIEMVSYSSTGRVLPAETRSIGLDRVQRHIAANISDGSSTEARRFRAMDMVGISDPLGLSGK